MEGLTPSEKQALSQEANVQLSTDNPLDEPTKTIGQEYRELAVSLNSNITIGCIREMSVRSDTDIDIKGDSEIGYYKKVTDNKYILCNDRVDTTILLLPDRTDSITAIRYTHYHRIGFVYGITVYLANQMQG